MPKIGLIIVDTQNYTLANNALQNTIQQINPSHILVYTDHITFGNEYDKKIIDKITSINQYNEIILNKIVNDIHADHYLIIQYDGFAIDGSKFDNEFLKYDYIGAPWPQFTNRNVGNGGFSLRSKKLIELTADLSWKRTNDEAEDLFICRSIGEQLEQEFSAKFANTQLAAKFSYEAPFSNRNTFGFHGFLNLPIIYQNDPEYFLQNLDRKTIIKRFSEIIYGIRQCKSEKIDLYLKLLRNMEMKFEFSE